MTTLSDLAAEAQRNADRIRGMYEASLAAPPVLPPIVAPTAAPLPTPQPPSNAALIGWSIMAMQVANAALPRAEVDWLVGHIMEGAPGLQQFLQSESITPIVQLLHETYKQFLEGKIK